MSVPAPTNPRGKRGDTGSNRTESDDGRRKADQNAFQAILDQDEDVDEFNDTEEFDYHEKLPANVPTKVASTKPSKPPTGEDNSFLDIESLLSEALKQATIQEKEIKQEHEFGGAPLNSQKPNSQKPNEKTNSNSFSTKTTEPDRKSVV